MMKKSLAALWMVLALVGLLGTGCNKDKGNGPDESAPAGVTDEQSAMKYFANNDEFVNNDEQTIDDQEVQPTDYGTFGKIDASIVPLRWGRFVTSVVRTVTLTIQPGDSIAVAQVHKVITGVLKIRGLNTSGDTILVQKPFTDNSDRNVIFKRIGRGTPRFWLHWVPVATSLVDGGTPNGQINLTKVQFITATDTITITDPLRYFLRYRWLRLFVHNAPKDVPEIDAGAPVTVRATVVSASPDTDLVALRYGRNQFQRRRLAMRCISQVQVGNNYERVFERAFVMHFHRGSFHAAVDAATKATLFDDDITKYAVSWWGVPYRVN